MSRSAEQAWNDCLSFVKGNVSPETYRTWFAPLSAVALIPERGELQLIVRVKSPFILEWLDEHYYHLLTRAVEEAIGPDARLYYQVQTVAPEPEVSPITVAASQPARRAPETLAWSAAVTRPVSELVATNLHPGYTFDNFIVGDCNSMARGAALAIADNPGGTPFNPFLVYGGVGLGKTHVVQALGNHVHSHHPDRRVVYVSSEVFTQEFVSAIQKNQAQQFADYYRSVDVLIIDDVQFFGGKEKTQEVFFHVFNSMTQRGKQVVLSADRPPRDIEGIEERLLSRFRQGLQADLQPPDLETRTAILEHKARLDGYGNLHPDVINLIAARVTSNIRDLEGALIKLEAHMALSNDDLDAAKAKELLRDLTSIKSVVLSVSQIQETLCEYSDVSTTDLLGKVAEARTGAGSPSGDVFLPPLHAAHAQVHRIALWPPPPHHGDECHQPRQRPD